jgi:hypothetical protein
LDVWQFFWSLSESRLCIWLEIGWRNFEQMFISGRENCEVLGESSRTMERQNCLLNFFDDKLPGTT